MLGCNDYEVIDLGVMVPWTRILETAREREADLIGLSGLITPSLEEMRVVASEMEREGMTTPLLIGGATTSKAHTAVKLEPAYSGPGGARGRRLTRGRRGRRPHRRRGTSGLRGRATGRVRRGARWPTRVATPPTGAFRWPQARAARLTLDWGATPVPAPSFTGVRTLADYPLDELVERIDWSPFFATWELKGRYPAILSDPTVGAAARELSTTRSRCSSESAPRVCCGPMPWSASGRPARPRTTTSWSGPTRRVQASSPGCTRCVSRSLAVTVDPTWRCLTSWPRSTPGWATTSGASRSPPGTAWPSTRLAFEAAHDDYSAILLTALADRLAEAFAERLHERVRRELWGYAADEALDNEALIAESYQGIRPAPGYPACPDHTEKATLFGLLEAESRAASS